MKKIREAIDVEYLEDCNRIKEYVLTHLGIELDIYQVYLLWEAFSGTYCAQFIEIDNDKLNEFIDYIVIEYNE